MYRLAIILLCIAFAAASALAQTRTSRAKPSLKGETRTSAPRKSPAVKNRATFPPEEALMDVPPPPPG